MILTTQKLNRTNLWNLILHTHSLFIWFRSFSRASLFEIPTKTNTVFGCNWFFNNYLSEPAGHKVIQDEENNILDFCWFEGMTTKLTITATSILETKPIILWLSDLSVHYNQLPLQYDELQKKLLAALEGQLISHNCYWLWNINFKSF
jgi:hypothetical protein